MEAETKSMDVIEPDLGHRGERETRGAVRRMAERDSRHLKCLLVTGQKGIGVSFF